MLLANVPVVWLGARFADPEHAAEVAGFFFDELQRNGVQRVGLSVQLAR